MLEKPAYMIQGKDLVFIFVILPFKDIGLFLLPAVSPADKSAQTME